jgi:hypothetical protein
MVRLSHRARSLAMSLILLWTAPVAWSSPPPGGDPPAASEYEVKAAFLFHFTQFTDWPAALFEKTGGRIVIGVLGVDPFGPDLDRAVLGKTVQGHPLVVQRFPRAEDVGPCQVLFVGGSDRKQLRVILGSLKGKPVLTVGESDQFLAQGGIIAFLREDEHIRFSINLDAADRSALKFSAKLLKVARSVRDSGPRN